MKQTYLLFLLLCTFLSSQAQEFRIHGTIRSQELLITNAEVVNQRTKSQTYSDRNGYFIMDVALDDEIYIIHKDFEIKKIVIGSSTVWLYEIELTPKAIQLEEVDVSKPSDIKVKVTPGEIKLGELSKHQFTSQTNVYDGSMPYATDFIALYKGLVKLFKKKPEATTTPAQTITIESFVETYFTEDYWEQTLKIPKEKKHEFLTFCAKDPKLKNLLQMENGLELTEFFLQKKKEFEDQAVIVAPKP